tara:strand:+ start:682 stop:825 length:144 start_codon:yes stop_codon:yes gene_type:complete
MRLTLVDVWIETNQGMGVVRYSVGKCFQCIGACEADKLKIELVAVVH